jgi:dihydroorotate dehydrogenase (NAD+) catalytic subunit
VGIIHMDKSSRNRLPTPSLPRYDPCQSYRWNFDHAPDVPAAIEPPAIPGSWTYCGRPVPSPLGIAAGPLLNGRWILYYAALGFDLLTYKTVRSSQRECYPLPNLLPVACQRLESAGRVLSASDTMQASWAVSFGMPSMSPDFWRADIEWTRSRLAKEKLLSVSVVASAEPDWSLDDLAADFARCARWAVASGADCIETNFSCPNVSTSDGQLYQQPAAAALVAAHVREAIGKVPYLIKVGYVDSDEPAEQLIDTVAPYADALAMTNCISARVNSAAGQPHFCGESRGIGGEAILAASIAQVERFARLIRQRGSPLRVIGVGGIFSAEHVAQYLKAGAEAVQLATAAMLDPEIGLKIRRDWPFRAAALGGAAPPLPPSAG